MQTPGVNVLPNHILLLIVRAVCFHHSSTSLAGVLKTVARIKRFIRLHIVITETIK